MATLPAATDFTGASITEAQFKTAMTDLRTYLADQLGTLGTPAAALNALGTLCNDYVAKSGAYTVVSGDRGKTIGCSGTFTLTLTAAATMGDGFSFAVKNTGTGVITIDPNSSETVDSLSSLAIYAGEACILICDGTAWQTVVKSSGVPAGTVISYAASTAPPGWFKADGTAVSRTTYSALYTAIGVTFGAGDGATTFNLPDLRGEFIRGYHDGDSADPDYATRTFGSLQTGAVESHAHSVTLGSINSGGGYGGGGAAGFATGNTGAAGGSETRPRNIALLMCIKY